MGSEPFFSIVIPAYNIEPYVESLLHSVKKQNFHNYEVIFVNESSTDRTRETAESVIAGDPRFQFITLPTSGSASNCRNYGIEHARGHYLIFIDGDDWLKPEALKFFHDYLGTLRFEPDIIMAGADWHENGKIFVQMPEYIGNRPLTGEELMRARCTPEHLGAETWRRIYRRDFLRENRLLQIPGRKAEDAEWTPRVFFAAQTIVGVAYSYYGYRKRPDSETTAPSLQTLYDKGLNALTNFDFFENTQLPPSLLRPFADFCCDSRFIILPFAWQIYPPAERRKAFLTTIGTRENFMRYRRILQKAGMGKKTLYPVMLLAYWNFTLGEWVFRWVYRPLIFNFWGKNLRKLLKRR